LDAVANQTGLKKSRVLRELLMAYGAGVIRPPSLPEVSPIKTASMYVTERLTAGKD